MTENGKMEITVLKGEFGMTDFSDKIQIIKKGITEIPADCVVNAANDGLWAGGGVCGAIFRAAGTRQLTAACDAIGHCDTGKAVITPAFNLDAKYIIHAVGPRYMDGKHGEPALLYDAYKNSLELAMQYDCHSIVFPVISSGIFGYPRDAAWQKALLSCTDFLKKHPDYDLTILFAVPNDQMNALGQKILQKISEEDPPVMSSLVVSTSSKPSRIVNAKVVADRKEAKNDSLPPSPKRPSTREERISIFNDTQLWISGNTYLSDAVTRAKKRTKVFHEDAYPAFDASAIREETILVTQERSFAAAMNLAGENPDAKIAVMNFANAFHPGGGVAWGASAQEECLCRCSTLYPLLNRYSLKKEFYDYHSKRQTPKATDSLIYTEGVVICKSDDEHPKRLPQTEWVTVDVITLAAPDLRRKSNPHIALTDGDAVMNDAELFGYHVKRAIHMLTCAAAKGANILVLGAFGCGAFENDPAVVANAYKTALSVFPKVFDKVVFAIYTSAKDERNYTVFRDILG